ncbi:hypothetical protein KP509_04G028100 [Ceratopteris richardii]|uniref:Protein kinase domain-containing protein n=3 Tax=Euphyllophyta TaxID=78536 RepID=A0A8T2UR67_CERRI|nr:hypothetical protein KP509_04G028100 [Ceratopteris richardii]KAH7438713.1 hypothetical protein KP509_04G028100 [Ceratopteris richardii]
MHSTGEGMQLSRRELIRGVQVLPESLRDAGGRDRPYDDTVGFGSPNFIHSPTLGQSPGRDFCIDQKWLIDPKLLFVGPRISEGGHGKVYEGKYRDQNVALKLIQTSGTPEEVVKRESRFAREVSLLSRVKHKNLVKFIGACKEPSMMVVVTELLQGGSLRKFLLHLRPKQVDRWQAIKFALDIAEAMDCLHKHGIIHRDLKPDNLLLTADQKTVKLVDFGLAREETLTEMMTAETGTYRWMAPELYSTVTLRNGEKKHYNQKVDVYSFSIVLWELLTNRMPFEGMSNLQAAYAAAFKGTRPVLSDDLDLPEELTFLLQSCWAEDPNSRPDFTQVVRMLNAYLLMLPSPEHSAPQMQMVSRSMPVPREISSTSYTREKHQDDHIGNSDLGAVKSSSGFFDCFGHCI